MPPHVVPGRDDVRAGGEQLLRELAREADSVGRVLSVDNAEVGLELVAELGQPRLDRPPPGGAEYVTEKEDAQLGSFLDG